MKQKQIIQRNLPLTDKYKLLNITRQSLEFAEVILPCDNCNAALVNLAEIVNQDGKRFTVGLDCMKTLTKALVNLSDYEFELYAFNSALRFYGLMKKSDKVRIKNGFVNIEYKDKKGNLQLKSELKHCFDTYNFDLTCFDVQPSELELKVEKILQDIQDGSVYHFSKSENIGFKNDRYTVLDDTGRFMRYTTPETCERAILRDLLKS
jgi:hypothetical protein